MNADLARDLKIVAATLYGEADEWNPADARLIAAVICNRSAFKGAWWGDTLAGVCFARRQFSCWDWWVGETAKYAMDSRARLLPLLIDGDRAKPDPAAFRSGWAARCLEIATIEVAAFRNGRPVDPSGGADHYHASYVRKPAWVGMAPTVAVSDFRPKADGSSRGRHLFYRLGPQTAGVEAPARSPIPQSKPAQGAILTGGGLSVGALLDWIRSGGETIRETVAALFGGGPVPVAALWVVVAVWAASMLWLLWLRRQETRGWVARLPHEDSPPLSDEEKARLGEAAEGEAVAATQAETPKPLEADRIGRIEAALAALLEREATEPKPPKPTPRRKTPRNAPGKS